MFREDVGLSGPADLSNNDVGLEMTLRRDEVAPVMALGETFLEAVLEAFLLRPSSLPSAAYMSSSTEISRRVRGRSVELLFDVDNEEPLEGFMACGRRAEWARVELHRPSDLSGRADAWHGVTGTW